MCRRHVGRDWVSWVILECEVTLPSIKLDKAVPVAVLRSVCLCVWARLCRLSCAFDVDEDEDVAANVDISVF
ncbi:GM16294 [Drosophila sechellia]|uniref:GM16294 n=1 Tax=Drosophila sechellia TaxID=7238 RepID=B4IH08_DROSE|nr:GM16294 [Drosophila sechellia]